MSVRLEKHYQIDSALVMMSDAELQRRLRRADFTQGWGKTGTMRVNNTSVFVKTVPLTDLEIKNLHSTKNLYRIPSWYSYGVGSAGFGAFRELAAHRKTTNWVRSGEANGFPLLHHFRILPVDQPVVPIDDLDGYVKYWNDSQAVRRYMHERAEAKFELVLFLEHLIPFPVWAMEHPSKIKSMVRSALGNVDFMRSRGMLHFDAHANNWLTDGKQILFTDFGLVLDESFELTSTERAFMKQHQNYDYAQVIATVGDAILLQYRQLNARVQRQVEGLLGLTQEDGFAFNRELIRHAEQLHGNKLMKLSAPYRLHLKQYLPIIELKNSFFLELRAGKKRIDQYPSQGLNRLLKKHSVL